MKQGFEYTRHGCIHYYEEGAGKPLILLHSNGASAHQYDDCMQLFAKNWRVIAWDMPGHGDSDPITKHYSIEAYADAVIALMDALKIDRAAVAGDSVGGSICIALSRDHAHRMDGVVISECPLRTTEDWLNTWGKIEATYSQPTQDMNELLPRFRKATHELLQRWNTDRNKAGAWAMVDVMRAMREFDTVGALNILKAPSAAILGAKGNSLNKKDLYGQCVGANNVAVLADCGHFPMIDDPKLFSDEVTRLLKQVVK